MFSSRTPQPHTSNRLTRTIAELRSRGVDLIDLTESNPTRCRIRYDAAGIARALAQTASAPYEPDPQGLAAARAEVARYYGERGMRVDPGSLVLTSGTSEGYAHLFTLLAEPGDEVLVPTPGYPLLEVLTSVGGIGLIHYRQTYDDGAGWRVDIERLRGSISTRARAIVVVSPNNPTGAFLKTRELEQVSAICREHDLALIVDEVFSDYGVGSDPGRVPSAVEHDECLTFVLNGLSKISGLPQMKLAWIHASGPAELRANAVERLAFVADAYLSVGTPVQRAVSELLQQRHSVQRQIQERVNANDAALRSLLDGRAGCRVLRREGGWYGVLQLPDELVDEDVARSAPGAGARDRPSRILLRLSGRCRVPGAEPAAGGRCVSGRGAADSERYRLPGRRPYFDVRLNTPSQLAGGALAPNSWHCLR